MSTASSVPLVCDDAVRVAVGSPTDRRSGVWRIWFGKQDIFAGYRSVAKIRKASIHYERPGQPTQMRYVGYTSEWEEMHGRSTRLADRAHAYWKGMEIAPNYFIEFRIRVPECELRRFVTNESPQTHWLTPPPPKMASEVTIVSGPPTHAGLIPSMLGDNFREIIGEFQLPNGRYVWVVQHHIECASPEWLRAARADAKSTFKSALQSGQIRDILPNTRVGAGVDCGDGSYAEVELAADFLRGRKRA